jgi:hypothetical protein
LPVLVFVTATFWVWVLVMVGFPPAGGFEVGFAASLDEAASVIASATRVVSRRMMSPCPG